MPENQKPEPYKTKTHASIALRTRGDRETGMLQVLEQRKMHPDGSLSGPFIAVRLDTGRRNVFLSVDMAGELHRALGGALQTARAAKQRVHEEYTARKRKREQLTS